MALGEKLVADAAEAAVKTAVEDIGPILSELSIKAGVALETSLVVCTKLLSDVSNLFDGRLTKLLEELESCAELLLLLWFANNPNLQRDPREASFAPVSSQNRRQDYDLLAQTQFPR